MGSAALKIAASQYAVAMRLFVGIGLPPALAEALARAARTLSAAGTRIRWTPPENLHLTLSFLGQVEPSRLDAIEQALATLRSSALPLQLDGPGIFPSAGILYVQVKPAPALLSFAEQVFRAMETCGFPREPRPYAPHITLARAKGRIQPLARGQQSPAFHQRFEAREFRLYESLTLPQGAQYRVVHAFPFRD